MAAAKSYTHTHAHTHTVSGFFEGEKKERGEGGRDLCFDELRCGDEADARTTLDPHLAVDVEAGRARAPAAAPEEYAERVGVAVRVAGPVFDAGVDDVELEGEDVLEDVRARGRGHDGRERAEEVRLFGGDLVEEAEAGEGGEAEGPQLLTGRSALGG